MPWTISDVDRHKQGLTDEEKRRWVAIANAALARCLDDGGEQSECDATAIRIANGTVGNNAGMYSQTARISQDEKYPVTIKTHQGTKHFVVPVVMLVEGVHHGSHGPLLHLAEEFGRWYGAWNGIPVVVGHPEIDGVGVSANYPDIVDEQVVGRVYNAHVEGGKLKGEVWLNSERLVNVAPEVLSYIKSGSPLDVSVGVFTDDEATTGVWQGEDYIAIARNHRPDHLALLPGGEGACSWADGCGIRTNTKGDDEIDKKNKKFDAKGSDNLAAAMPEAAKTLARAGYSVQTYSLGYQELAGIIQRRLDEMDTTSKLHFLVEVFDDYFIYRVTNTDMVANEQYYKRGYSMSEDDKVEFGDNVIPVTRKVEYVEINTNKGGKTMSDKSCCPERVEVLIQSKNNFFDDKDREWLAGLSEEQIEKLEAIDQIVVEANKKAEEKAKGGITKDEAVQVLKEQFSSPEQFLEILPPEHREQMEYSIKLHRERRQELITHIAENTDVYTEDELKERSTSELEKLAKAITPKVDYSVRGGMQGLAATDEILLPPGVAAKTETE